MVPEMFLLAQLACFDRFFVIPDFIGKCPFLKPLRK
jgi:hypothetical protein